MSIVSIKFPVAHLQLCCDVDLSRMIETMNKNMYGIFNVMFLSFFFCLLNPYSV